MGLLNKTYELARAAPAPMSWDDYESVVKREWSHLIDRQPPPSEREVQLFLETHPCMVPGAFGLAGGKSGHYPEYDAVITQAPLPSYRHRVPDFLWLAQYSDVQQPVLVEIEAPNKKWWTQAGNPTADLTQALNQIAEWKTWMGDAQNILAFRRFYGLDQGIFASRSFEPQYALIYGRRAEANLDPALMAKRANLTADNVFVMSYDRLVPDPNFRELFCVRNQADGFSAVSVPATMTLRPTLATTRSKILNREAAIRNNPYLSSERRDFLLSRLSYWDTWANDKSREGMVDGGDRE